MPVPLGAALGAGVAGGMNAQNQFRSGVAGQAFMQPGAQSGMQPNFLRTVYGTPGLFGTNLLATPPSGSTFSSMTPG